MLKMGVEGTHFVVDARASGIRIPRFAYSISDGVEIFFINLIIYRPSSRLRYGSGPLTRGNPCRRSL